MLRAYTKKELHKSFYVYMCVCVCVTFSQRKQLSSPFFYQSFNTYYVEWVSLFH